MRRHLDRILGQLRIKMKIPINKIDKNPYDTREDYGDLAGLKSSIERHGLLQSFLLRPGKRQGEYELVFGGRRFEALKQLGKVEIEAEVREFKDSDMATLALCENVHRKDYTPAELARSFRIGMTATGYEITEFAQVVGENPAKVESYLGLLDLPERILSRSTAYSVHDLMAMARLQQLSQALRITYEDVLGERTFSSAFSGEILRSCLRVFSSKLPLDKKVDLCGEIITQDYSHIAPRNFKNIGVYATQILEQALVRYDSNLQKVAKAIQARQVRGAIIPTRAKVRKLEDIEDINDRLNEITDVLRTTAMHLERTEKKGYYEKSSRRNQKSFRVAVNKLASKLEIIIKNGEQA